LLMSTVDLSSLLLALRKGRRRESHTQTITLLLAPRMKQLFGCDGDLLQISGVWRLLLR
jgi:hypothetical protein